MTAAILSDGADAFNRRPSGCRLRPIRANGPIEIVELLARQQADIAERLQMLLCGCEIAQ